MHVPGRPQAPSEPPDGPTAASSARSTAQERAQAVRSARGAGGVVGGREGQRARTHMHAVLGRALESKKMVKLSPLVCVRHAFDFDICTNALLFSN